jgi:hypothetical protein
LRSWPGFFGQVEARKPVRSSALRRSFGRSAIAYRVLFTLENDLIFVHQVKDRKDAYRD